MTNAQLILVADERIKHVYQATDDLLTNARSVVSAESEGFDARVDGGCAKFDLYFDGKPRADKVHLASPVVFPPQVPFERCPPGV